MTAKGFFKSVAFKCIMTLLCVLLVSGVFLTIMHGLLEVTPEEKLNRAISQIYGRNIKVTEQVLDDDQKTPIKTATVKLAYLDEDGNYLVKAAGKGGFGGDVTCWVLVEVKNGAVSGVSKVSIINSESQGETLLANINFLDKYKDKKYEAGYVYSTDDGFTVTGATLSSTAINNAVNGAVAYVNMKLGNAVGDDPYKEWLYTDCIDTDKLTYEVKADGSIDYVVVTTGLAPAGAFTINITVGADKKIAAFEIVVNGCEPEEMFKPQMSPEILSGEMFVGKGADEIKAILGDKFELPESGTVINTGASRSNFLCLSAAAFATANFDAAKTKLITDTLVYTDSIDMEKLTYTVSNGSVEYTIVTTGLAPAGAFTVKVTVGADKKVAAFEITVNGCEPEEMFKPQMAATILSGEMFVGKTADEIVAILGDKFELPESGTAINTGASRSNFLCLSAAAFAAANYDAYIALNDLMGGNA